MTDSFVNHPVSITEARAERGSDGSLWTPRDALISILRDIDEGRLEPSDLVIVMRVPLPEEGPHSYKISRAQSSANLTLCIGLLEEAKHHILRE